MTRPISWQAAQALAARKNLDGATGWVYFITDGTAIKVGYSVSPDHRLLGLQTSHHAELKVLARFRGTRADEGAIHYKLRHARIRREWFNAPEAEKMMAELRVSDDDMRAGYLTLGDAIAGRKSIVRESNMRNDPTAENLRITLAANRDTWPVPLQASATKAICSLEYEHRNRKHGISDAIHAMNMTDLREFDAAIAAWRASRA